MHGAVREEEEYNLFNHSSKTTPPPTPACPLGWRLVSRFIQAALFSSDVSGAALRTDGVGQSWRGVTVKMSP